MRRQPLATVAVIATLLAALATAARADDRAGAERFFRAGERAYNAGQYLTAAEAFEEAYQRLPAPAIAFSAAQAYRLQYFLDKQPQRLKRSVELYRAYIAKQKEGGRVPDAAQSLAELEPILDTMMREGRMNVTAPPERKTTRLMVVSQVDGARGSIDDAPGALPLVKEVTPGDHTIKAEAEGYAPVTLKATAVDGTLVPVEVDLRPLPVLLDVRAIAGARITIDGRPAGTAPVTGLEVAAGRHFVVIQHGGRRPFGREIEVARGERRTIAVDLRTTGQRKASWLVLGGAGALLVAAGVGGGIAIAADRDASDLEDKRAGASITAGELDRYDDLRARRDTAARVAWITGGGAAVLGAIGAVMYVFDNPDAEAPPMMMAPERPAPRTPTVQPMMMSAHGAGMMIGGRF